MDDVVDRAIHSIIRQFLLEVGNRELKSGPMYGSNRHNQQETNVPIGQFAHLTEVENQQKVKPCEKGPHVIKVRALPY